MKRFFLIGLVLVISVLFCLPYSVKASNSSIDVKADKTKVAKQESFSIILSGECDEGINGLEAVISYDENVLEVVEKNVANSNWVDLGKNTTKGIGITVMCNSTDTLTKENVYEIKFKVKEKANVTSTKITVSDMLLYSDKSNTYKQPQEDITIQIQSETGKQEKNFPRTGISYIFLSAFVLLTIFGILSFLQYKKYKQI